MQVLGSLSPFSLLGFGTSGIEDGKYDNNSNSSSNGQDLDGLLQQFSKGEQPASSRVDHSVKQQEKKPVTLLESWKYLYFVGSQASSAAGAFVSHHVYGPQKASWGEPLE